MIYAIVLFANSAANFVFGVALSALLGPAEFGRYATVALAALTIGVAAFEWLRASSLRFSGDVEGRLRTAASLDVGYLGAMALLCVAVGAAGLSGATFGLTPALLALTPLLAVALTRVDFAGAQFRARDMPRAFAALYGLRQVLSFVFVVGAAYYTRDSTMTVAAFAACSLIAAIALSAALRTPGAQLRQASHRRIAEFLIYAKPVVASVVIYQLISLINRQVALDHLGAVATGELSLATDLGQRLFFVVNSVPELLLFQFALQRDRAEGRGAAEGQIGVNMVLMLALLAPLAAGYMTMAPTFEALVVPSAYRGEYARLTLELAPGFLVFCLISSGLNPVFQLAKRTWPVTVAALGALATDFALLQFGGAAASVDALARAYSVSLCVGFLIAAALALRYAGVRPRMRDMAIVAAATIALAFALRPLNGLNSRAVAAALALICGGGLYGAVLLAFDVAGLRGWAAQRLRAPRWAWATALRPHF
jgi:O-antigen/teichoic acid export membrane protein